MKYAELITRPVLALRGDFIRILILCLVMGEISSAHAQPVLFDFDAAPVYTPLPISLTVEGITADFFGTGEGYSIQDANVMGFTPEGFSGHVIYPSSVFLADLLISFDQELTDFSIMYSSQELGCDDAETMRVTAYLNGNFVGTNTNVVSNPGTWPSDVLTFSDPSGFDSVVVHYDSPPPTCSDYGVIFMADNMWVTPLSIVGVNEENVLPEINISPNPATNCATILFSLAAAENMNIAIYDINGRVIKTLMNGNTSESVHRVSWNFDEAGMKSGIYFISITSGQNSSIFKLIVIRE